MSVTILDVLEHAKNLDTSKFFPSMRYNDSLIVPTSAVHLYNESVFTTAQVRRAISLNKFDLTKLEGDINGSTTK